LFKAQQLLMSNRVAGAGQAIFHWVLQSANPPLHRKWKRYNRESVGSINMEWNE